MKAFFLILFATSLFAQNIDLKNSQNQYDYIIITIDDFITTCEIFKEHKESFNNFSVLITTKDDILSEFNAHSTVADNIRDFISFAGNNWQNPKPKYFLFAADLDSIPNFVFRSVELPDYNDSSYSDFYYGVDIIESDSSKIKYSIGRVPARDTIELNNYFSKVINYETTNKFEPWNNKNLFVTDDQYSNQYGNDSTFEGNIFIDIAKNIASQLPELIVSDFVIPIDTSEYYGKTDSIFSKINSGQSSVFFSGHSSNNFFTHESLFTAFDVSNLENVNKPFFISILGGQQFARNNLTSIVNEMIVSQNGALASINSVGEHYVNQGSNFYENVWSKLYTDISLGDIFISTINSNPSYNESRKFNLFGDPSIVLKNDISTSVLYNTEELPAEFKLTQNYPNPFNPTTTINYSVPLINGVANHSLPLQLKVYDILGREVITLVNERQKPGNYEVTFDAGNLSSGVYYYQLKTRNFVRTMKLILLK